MNFDTPGFETPVPVTDLEPSMPARRRRRWLWVTAPLLAVAIAVAAVIATSGSNAKSPGGVLADASGRTTASGTARVSVVETLSLNGRSSDLFDISGATDWAHKTSTITMASRGEPILVIRQFAGTSYMSSPLVTLPNGADWISATPADLKVPAGGSALGTNDPTQGLQYLSAIKGNPRVVGHESVGGVDTTHYVFTIDMKTFLDRVAKASAALGSDALGSSLATAGSSVDLSKVPAAAWIDHEGRVRRFTLTIAMSQGGESVKATDVISFSHFDEPVSAVRPPASDTVPFSQAPDFMSRLSTAERASTLS